MKPTLGPEKRWDRYQKLKDANDVEGIVRLEFGYFIRLSREAAGLFQGQAAKSARLSRTEWNRIENGHALPHASNIPNMAYAINLDPAVLFKRAGYAVPRKYSVYGKKEACSALHNALSESASMAEFLFSMGFVWQKYIREQTYKNEPTVAILSYSQILAHIVEHFTLAQRLQLARALMQRRFMQRSELLGLNLQQFIDDIDNELAELRRRRKG